MRLDRDGQQLNNFQVEGWFTVSVAWDGENIWYYGYEEGAARVHQITPEGEELHVVEIGDFVGEEFVSIAWAIEHYDGHLWIYNTPRGRLYQLNVDEDQAHQFQVADLDFGVCRGLTHDGDDLWISDQDSWSVIDDGIVEPHWLILKPGAGMIEPNDETTVELAIAPMEMEAGVFEVQLEFEFREEGDEIELGENFRRSGVRPGVRQYRWSDHRRRNQ